MGNSHRRHDSNMCRTLIAIATLAACATAFTGPMVGRVAFPRASIRMDDTAELMTPDKLKEAFSRFDMDNSGQVDLEEFKDKMKKLDLPFNDMELEQMFNDMDDSGNGGVDCEEFQGYLMKNAYVGVVRRLAAAPSKIREVYDSFRGSESVLEFDNFETGMKSLGLPYNKMELKDMFGEIDETNNGGVDFEEFESFMSQTVLPQWAQTLKQ